MIETCCQERGKGDQFILGTKQPRVKVQRECLRRGALRQALEGAFGESGGETCLGGIHDAGLHPGLFPQQTGDP